MPETDQTAPPEVLMRALLEGSVKFLDRATTPGEPPAPFLGDAMAAAYAGAAARLLHALMQVEPDVCRAVAGQLHEWMEFGEPLAEWVAERAAERGIDTDRTTHDSRLTTNREGDRDA